MGTTRTVAVGLLLVGPLLVGGGCSRASPKAERGDDSATASEIGGDGQVAGNPGKDRSNPMPNQVDAVDATDREVEAHIERLANEHPDGRAPAEDWLVEHAERARPRLRELAASDKIGLRVSGALRVLGRIGAAGDVALLAEVARKTPQSSTGWDAAMALAVHEAPEANVALREMLASDQENLVGNALIALGKRASEENRAAIEAKLDAESRRIRFKAVRALVMMGAEPSADALRDRLSEEVDEEVTRAIEGALGSRKKAP